jgi:hypothetical protein
MQNAEWNSSFAFFFAFVGLDFDLPRRGEGAKGRELPIDVAQDRAIGVRVLIESSSKHFSQAADGDQGLVVGWEFGLAEGGDGGADFFDGLGGGGGFAF